MEKTYSLYESGDGKKVFKEELESALLVVVGDVGTETKRKASLVLDPGAKDVYSPFLYARFISFRSFGMPILSNYPKRIT